MEGGEGTGWEGGEWDWGAELSGCSLGTVALGLRPASLLVVLSLGASENSRKLMIRAKFDVIPRGCFGRMFLFQHGSI